LATDFGNRFFNAYNFKNTKDSLPIAWHFVCQPIKTPISDLQLLLLGINAHINCDLYDALLVNYLPSNKKNIAHDFFLIDQMFLDVTQSIVVHISKTPRLTDKEKKVFEKTIKQYKSLGTYSRKRAFQSAIKTINGSKRRVDRIVKRKNRRANKWAYFIIHPKGKMKKSINIIKKYESTIINDNLKLIFPK